MADQITATRWIISQIGAREHYAVPRAFYRRGQLDSFYTDSWCSHGSSILRKIPGPARQLAGRRHPELPNDRVIAFTFRALLREGLMILREGKASRETSYPHFLRMGKWYGEHVAKSLQRRDLDPSQHCFFSFNTTALEPLQVMKRKGIVSVVDQIDPARVEDELVAQEHMKWPDWQATPANRPAAYFDRLAAEWEQATLVLVNSAWTSTALTKQGVPESKIVVVPLALQEHSATAPASIRPAINHKGALRVLWLGSVILRKGIPYLIEAAKRLRSAGVEFTVAGPVRISEHAVNSAPDNLKFIGHVNRELSAATYASADVFVLPTLSDGFAITQLEAMSQGLPVIATRNCGDVVTDGVDGLLIRAGDADSLTDAILRLDRDRDLVASMSKAAVLKSRQFTLDAYAERVEQAAAAAIRGTESSGPA